MKNIWILNHYASPPTGTSGTRHFDFAKYMQDSNIKVSVFCSGFSHGSKKDIVHFKKQFLVENVSGVNFIWIKTYPYFYNNYKRVINMLSYSIKVVLFAFRFERPDIIIASSVHPFTWISGYILSKLYKIKLIIEIRDLWPQTLIDLNIINKNCMAAKILYGIERFIYKRADQIITLLPRAYEYLEQYKIRQEKITYIPNGVDLERFDKMSLQKGDTVENILKGQQDKFTVLYTGSHDNTDALEYIISAAKKIQNLNIADIAFIFIGDGVKKNLLVDMVKKENIRNVFFYDSIKKTQIPYLLSKTDIAIMSLYNMDFYRYGISMNKLFDYMAGAKPIVFAGMVPENIVEISNCGLIVPPENDQAISDAVLNFYAMSIPERAAYGLNGRRYVQINHATKLLSAKLCKTIGAD
jgi:glycosyltransferase involved in cell wall biosynthesis